MQQQRDPLHRPLRLGAHMVPGFWRFLFADDPSELRYPSECRSTCANCPKVAQEGFHPDYRCCTYHPTIPNFLLGLALENAETAPLIDALIAESFATPEGLQPTAAQTHAALVQRAANDFGKEHAVVCRFLDAASGRCRMYAYRNGVCSTFFCIHDQGDDGREFWAKLQAAASQAETALAQWAMQAAGFDVAAYFARFDSMSHDVAAHTAAVGQAWTDEARKTLWGDWFGRERELYLACAALIRTNKERLGELADSVTLRSADAYDLAFRASLPEGLRDELDANGITAGQPVPPADLWYMFKLAHRNLWASKE